MTTTATTDAPHIWLGCLHCYNSGRLVGEWFDCATVADVTLDDVHAGTSGPWPGCEEVWGLDVDCVPVDREMGQQEAAEWGRVFEEVGADRWDALCAWVRSGCHVAEGEGDLPVVAEFEDRFCGRWPSFDEYADALADDVGLHQSWPEEAVRYFDWATWKSDLCYDYTVASAPAPDYGVFIFRNT